MSRVVLLLVLGLVLADEHDHVYQVCVIVSYVAQNWDFVPNS